MKQMFYQAWSFNRDLSPWNVAGVTTMYRMFFEATAFDQVLCWDVANANTVEMFLGSSGSVSPTCQADGAPIIRPLLSKPPLTTLWYKVAVATTGYP